MEKIELVEKLRTKTNISYDEANIALENSNWDMLDAILYLEERGIVKKPSISIFYTNEYKESYKNQGEIVNINESGDRKRDKSKKDFDGIFEDICEIIDTCNNIFIELRRKDRVFLKLPFTVLILLLIFMFWIIIPLMIGGLFFDIEFIVSTKKINTDKIDKVNKAFSEMSKNARIIKEKLIKGFK